MISGIIEKNKQHQYSVHDLIKALTDIYDEHGSKKNLQSIFDSISVCLLRQTKIVTLNEQYYLREIEFYYYDSENNNPDPYCHKNKRQTEFGEWYLHRFSALDPFLKNRRNGIDITFGNKSKEIYGGILIRKIENIKTHDLIVGINNVARELIKDMKAETINEIALGFGQKAFNKNEPLHLEVGVNSLRMPIFKSQRNGLSYKKDEIGKKFFKIPYCYYNHDLNNTQIIRVR